MAKLPENMKTFNMRITKEMWTFLKHESVNQGCSMTEIVNNCLDKYKKKLDLIHNREIMKDIVMNEDCNT